MGLAGLEALRICPERTYDLQCSEHTKLLQDLAIRNT